MEKRLKSKQLNRSLVMNSIEHRMPEVYNKWLSRAGERQRIQARAGVLDLFEPIDQISLDKVYEATKSEPENLHIRIDSPGGDVSAYVAMVGLLNNVENLTTEITGMAVSAAGNLFLNGKNRLIHSMSLFMLHNVWQVVPINQHNYQKYVDEVAQMDDMFLKQLFLKKLKINDEKVFTNYLKGDKFMSMEQMEEYGVFTDLIKSEEKEETTEAKQEEKEDEEERETKSEEKEEEEDNDKMNYADKAAVYGILSMKGGIK